MDKRVPKFCNKCGSPVEITKIVTVTESFDIYSGDIARVISVHRQCPNYKRVGYGKDSGHFSEKTIEQG